MIPEFRLFGLGGFLRAGDASWAAGTDRGCCGATVTEWWTDGLARCRVLRAVAPRHVSQRLGRAREWRLGSLLVRWVEGEPID